MGSVVRLPLRLWPTAIGTLYRTFGARGIALRSVHEVRRATNSFRAAPRHVGASFLSGTAIGCLDPFVVEADRLASSTDTSEALARAERVVRGEYQAYRWEWRQLPKEPEEWLLHPHSRRRFSPAGSWWKTDHLDPVAGDIKDLWEPARFSWVYDLVRGFLLTGDDRFASAFYCLLGDWAESSPAFKGPHWSCGQETSIRATALLYAEANLTSAPSANPSARQLVTSILAASGERVRDAIGYAVSQRNNHAISEATGLVLLGTRFRGEHPEAEDWIRTGRRLLERLVVEQFAPDGWYVQHSFNYQRLALDQLVVAELALRSMGQALSSKAVSRIRAANELLVSMMDITSGVVPNHGANDGAYVLPIALADYRDFRPTVTAVSAMWQFPLPENITPNVEAIAWLGTRMPPVRNAIGDSATSGRSGWASVRLGGTNVFLRAGRYSTRPGHLDPLHLDVRINGREVVVDPGTFAYNGSPPWRNGLAGAGAHNGPVVDGKEPGIRGPRFLWYIWPQSQLTSCVRVLDGYELVAEIPGLIRRRVHVSRSRVIVDDEVLSDSAKTVTVNWLLHPDADVSQVSAQGATVVEAKDGEVTGWFSPGYGIRIPSRVVRVGWQRGEGIAFRTVISGV